MTAKKTGTPATPATPMTPAVRGAADRRVRAHGGRAVAQGASAGALVGATLRGLAGLGGGPDRHRLAEPGRCHPPRPEHDRSLARRRDFHRLPPRRVGEARLPVFDLVAQIEDRFELRDAEGELADPQGIEAAVVRLGQCIEAMDPRWQASLGFLRDRMAARLATLQKRPDQAAPAGDCLRAGVCATAGQVLGQGTSGQPGAGGHRVSGRPLEADGP